MDRWLKSHFVNGKPNNFFAHSWTCVDEKGNPLKWLLKCSTGEPCYNVQFAMPQRTYSDLILADIKEGSKMNVHCKAGVGNISYFAQQLVQLNDIVMSAIKQGVFADVAVPIEERDYYDDTIPQSLRQRLLEIRSRRRKEKIEAIETLLLSKD